MKKEILEVIESFQDQLPPAILEQVKTFLPSNVTKKNAQIALKAVLDN